MTTSPFTDENLPQLGARLRIAFNTTTPDGVKFVKGEEAVVCELHLSRNDQLWVAARTTDGRIYRAAFSDAFMGA